MSKRLSIAGGLITLVTVVASANQTPAPPDAPARQGAVGPLTTDEVQRRAAAVYDRVSRALIRVEREDGKLLGGEAAVIVTADGFVVYRGISGGGKKVFRLADGRRATGSLLGWSQEWGVGLIKLDGPGPWPQVNLADSGGVKAGQCVITLGYPTSEAAGVFPQPLLQVEGVTGSAVGRWFVVGDEKTARWRAAPVVVDLDGRLVGVGWFRYADGVGLGTVYTDAKVVRALWDDLAAGKNLDELRLRGAGREGDPAPPALQSRPRDVEEKAKAATVRIRRGPKDRGFSGTIVSADGLVATCAHGFDFVMPGTKVVVCLTDGRDTPGQVVGHNHLCDVGLVQLTDQGPWPHVEMGDSTRLRPGDPCLFAGYGPGKDSDREPHLRWSSVAAPWASHWHPRLETDPNTPFVGGDSGGGVFAADGRLVGMHGGIGGRGRPHTNMRIELLRKHRDELGGPYERSPTSPLEAAAADHLRAAEKTRGSVVEVLDGTKVVAQGTVLGRDGRILTLANVLPEAPTCRLPDGRVLPATVLEPAGAHNVAVLKLEAADLATPEWSKADTPPVGTLLAVAAPAGRATIGMVSHPTVSIPPEHGALWANVQDKPQGLEVAEVFQRAEPSLLRKGDVILSLDGQPTPNRDAYLKLWQRKTGAPIAGDQVRVAITREGKKVELRYVLGPPYWPRPDGQSPRCSGFASACSVAVNAEFPLGGPVLDRTGQVIGIAIAWRARGWLLVLPATTARAAAAK